MQALLPLNFWFLLFFNLLYRQEILCRALVSSHHVPSLSSARQRCLLRAPERQEWACPGREARHMGTRVTPQG